MKNNFIKAIIAIAIALSFVVLFTNCKKDVEESVPPSILGDWETSEYFLYESDTTKDIHWMYYDWIFRDNGYALYIDDNDTGYYTYETTPDSLLLYNNNGSVVEKYALGLTENEMVWEEVVRYDPIKDFSTIKRIKLDRK